MKIKKELDLLTFGEILLRLSPHENERLTQGNSFRKHIGGAELNVAAGSSRLGLKTGIISKIPEHAIGMYAKNELCLMGVDEDYLIYDSDKDARIGIYYYENGAYPRKPSVVYDRKYTSINKIRLEELPEDLFDCTRCFHTSGITLALSKQTRETGIEMIKKFKERKTLISFDVNFRNNLWTGQQARECIESILPYVDIFFCSEDTAHLTFDKEGDIKTILKQFAKEYSISIVAATQRIVHSPKRHTFSSVIYSEQKDKYYEEKPYENIEVIDRIGSGDAYIAGVLYGILHEKDNYQQALEYGNAASAVKNTISGDLLYSDINEICRIIKEHNETENMNEMNR